MPLLVCWRGRQLARRACLRVVNGVLHSNLLQRNPQVTERVTLQLKGCTSSSLQVTTPCRPGAFH
jgi:hypothetical protein